MQFSRWTFASLFAAAAAIFAPSLIASAADAPKKEEPKAFLTADAAGADAKAQGEYEVQHGDTKVGLQVIALGKEGFRVVVYRGGLPGAGWDQQYKPSETPGKWEGDAVKFTAQDSQASLTIAKDGTPSATTPEGAKVESVKKVDRQSPTLGAKLPQGAVVLFDGTNADAWQGGKMDDQKRLMVGTKSKQAFGDCQMHVEFYLPLMPDARGQGRANSGVYIQDRYEVQVLDSFGLKGEDNECGGLYHAAAPSVNMCLPPLTWQTYDMDFTAAKFDAAGAKTASARLTAKHNGVTIHDNVEIKAPSGGGQKETAMPGVIQLQNHGNPVLYRNIWVVEKK